MRKLRAALAQADAGIRARPEKTTVAEWLNAWIDGKQGITESTRTVYKRAITGHIIPALGDIRLRDLHFTHCQSFVRTLTRATKKREALAPSTVRCVINALSSAMTAAIRAGLIAANPCAELELPRLEKQPPRVLEREEERRFLEEVAESPYYNAFVVALNTGVRVSELLGLRWKDVDFASGKIRVSGQLTRGQGGAKRELTDTKTHQVREIVVAPFVLDALKAERRRQNENRLRIGAGWQNELGLVFTRDDGSPVSHSTIAGAFKRAAKRIGRGDLSIHSLRHTYITDELALGTDVRTIADTAGHASPRMTMENYASSTSESKAAAAKRRQEAHERAASGDDT